jgi:hypothetical protein
METFFWAYFCIGWVIFAVTMLTGGPNYSFNFGEKEWFAKRVEPILDSPIGGPVLVVVTIVFLVLIWPYHLRRTFQG